LDELKIDDVSMFPNPATNEVNLKSNKLSDVSIRIYNTLGKLMFYGKNLDLYNGLRINVSAFQSGVYFVKLNSEKGEITKKLILE
uniref:T9SS type A sorting domain-containing protein n=1 Tax=uncultured Winogradskyella sp. TaxID=395353 RepID=UPI002612E198